MAITLKLSISDPMLVKPKCVWEAVVFFNFRKNFQLFVYNFQKKLSPLKRILALPTWGQKCLIPELQPFEIKNFDLGHPVLVNLYKSVLLSFRMGLKCKHNKLEYLAGLQSRHSIISFFFIKSRSYCKFKQKILDMQCFNV